MLRVGGEGIVRILCCIIRACVTFESCAFAFFKFFFPGVKGWGGWVGSAFIMPLLQLPSPYFSAAFKPQAMHTRLHQSGLTVGGSFKKRKKKCPESLRCFPTAFTERPDLKPGNFWVLGVGHWISGRSWRGAMIGAKLQLMLRVWRSETDIVSPNWCIAVKRCQLLVGVFHIHSQPNSIWALNLGRFYCFKQTWT